MLNINTPTWLRLCTPTFISPITFHHLRKTYSLNICPLIIKILEMNEGRLFRKSDVQNLHSSVEANLDQGQCPNFHTSSASSLIKHVDVVICSRARLMSRCNLLSAWNQADDWATALTH